MACKRSKVRWVWGPIPPATSLPSGTRPVSPGVNRTRAGLTLTPGMKPRPRSTGRSASISRRSMVPSFPSLGQLVLRTGGAMPRSAGTTGVVRSVRPGGRPGGACDVALSDSSAVQQYRQLFERVQPDDGDTQGLEGSVAGGVGQVADQPDGRLDLVDLPVKGVADDLTRASSCRAEPAHDLVGECLAQECEVRALSRPALRPRCLEQPPGVRIGQAVPDEDARAAAEGVQLDDVGPRRRISVLAVIVRLGEDDPIRACTFAEPAVHMVDGERPPAAWKGAVSGPEADGGLPGCGERAIDEIIEIVGHDLTDAAPAHQTYERLEQRRVRKLRSPQNRADALDERPGLALRVVLVVVELQGRKR